MFIYCSMMEMQQSSRLSNVLYFQRFVRSAYSSIINSCYNMYGDLLGEEYEELFVHIIQFFKYIWFWFASLVFFCHKRSKPFILSDQSYFFAYFERKTIDGIWWHRRSHFSFLWFLASWVVLFEQKIITIYTIGSHIFSRRFWAKNNAWGPIGGRVRTIFLTCDPNFDLFSRVFPVVGVLSCVGATEDLHHIHRISHIFSQILSEKPCVWAIWGQSRKFSNLILKFRYFLFWIMRFRRKKLAAMNKN